MVIYGDTIMNSSNNDRSNDTITMMMFDNMNNYNVLTTIMILVATMIYIYIYISYNMILYYMT